MADNQDRELIATFPPASGAGSMPAQSLYCKMMAEWLLHEHAGPEPAPGSLPQGDEA